MLHLRKKYDKIVRWIATFLVCTGIVMTFFSDSYNTIPVIGLGVMFLLLCIIGMFFKGNRIQHFRPFILMASLIYFGFIRGGCPCILSYFQGFILFMAGKGAFWLSFVVIVFILFLSVVFGAIWCGWLCWLGALQEFIFLKNELKLLKTKKTQNIIFYIQTVVFVALVLWITSKQFLVLCGYDPFVSIFRLRIFNWVGYITVPLLIISSLFIYRPFCRIVCPIGWMLYIVRYIPFAAHLSILECVNCGKCLTYCKLDAIHNKQVEKTCMMCGECKKSNCKRIAIP